MKEISEKIGRKFGENWKKIQRKLEENSGIIGRNFGDQGFNSQEAGVFSFSLKQFLGEHEGKHERTV